MLEQLSGVPFNVASFLVTLTVVVFVHEFGHFWVARRCGVHCQSFSIGFGPELFGYTDRHGTRWKFSLIPLGGYVKMFGESETMQAVEGGKEGETRPRDLTPEERAVSLKYKPVGQRAAIVFAGPAVNFIFAIAVFWVVLMANGQSFSPPIIGKVAEGSAAADGGLMADDRVVAIDGKPVKYFEDIRNVILFGTGQTLAVKVHRGDGDLDLAITPRLAAEKDIFGIRHYQIGATSTGTVENVDLNPVQAMGVAVGQTYDMIEMTVVSIGQMVSGVRGTEEVSGVIRMAKASGEAAKTSAAGFALFMAILSLNLGFINLFPVPLLDGGHLLFYAIEAARGRPLSERVQEWGLRVGLVLVFALMIFATWNDITHLRS